MSKTPYLLLSALALLIFSVVIFFPFQATFAQFPPVVSYDWQTMTQKNPTDCRKAAQTSITKLFPERVEERKSGTCGQGRGYAACVVCIDEKEMVVGLATGPDGTRTESIVKQLLSGM